MNEDEREFQEALRRLENLSVKVDMLMDNHGKLSDRMTSLQDNVALYMTKIGELTVVLDAVKGTTDQNTHKFWLVAGYVLAAVGTVILTKVLGDG